MAEYPVDINHRLKEKPPTGWPWQLFLVTLIVFSAAILIYFGLVLGYRPFLQNEINRIQAEISNLNLQVSDEQRSNLVNFYSQLVNLDKILQNHTAASKIFNFLEENILPEVAVNSLGIEVGGREVSLDAAAKSYDNLIEQMIILEKSQLIEKASLESARLSDDLVHFRVKLIFQPKVFSLQ